MTATLIPRTAAMLIYGDLDKTELRHLPAGRSPIEDRGGDRAGDPLERLGGATTTCAPQASRRVARRHSWCARWSRAPT